MNQEETQIELSKLIQNDFIQIVTAFSERNMLDLNLVITFIQDINLLKTYKVDYLHNNEITEVMVILKEELKENTTARAIALLSAIDYLEDPQSDFKQHLYVNLVLRTNENCFMEAFSFFNVVVSTVKELFEDFINYIFNDSFLDLTDQIQASCIYKVWNTSQQLFNDNEASIFAYEKLKYLFEKALEKEKTEVAFWLYYTPLHYYNSGTNNDINIINNKFKNEIEKPLELYIKNKLIPKYNITPNKKKSNKKKRKKVAFVIQRIIKHSTIEIYFSLIKSLMKNPSSSYEFIIYDLSFPESGGSDITFVSEFKNLGVKYINLHKEIFGNTSPIYSLLEKAIKTREILINDNIDIFIGLHTRIEYLFLFVTRTCPYQVYWYHYSNAQYDVTGVDKRIVHGELDNVNQIINNYEFTSFQISFSIDFFNKPIDNFLLINERNKYPKSCVFLGSIGRLIKMENKEYLDVVFKIMDKYKNTIYIACGDGDRSNINSMLNKYQREDILSRFYFVGQVNPHIYGNIIDIYLDTFPLTGGNSKWEFVSKSEGKPIVMMNNKIYKNLLTSKGYDNRLIPISFTNDEYINITSKLIEDIDYRKKVGSLLKEEIIINESINKPNSNSLINIFNDLLK